MKLGVLTHLLYFYFTVLIHQHLLLSTPHMVFDYIFFQIPTQLENKLHILFLFQNNFETFPSKVREITKLHIIFYHYFPKSTQNGFQ